MVRACTYLQGLLHQAGSSSDVQFVRRWVRGMDDTSAGSSDNNNRHHRDAHHLVVYWWTACFVAGGILVDGATAALIQPSASKAIAAARAWASRNLRLRPAPPFTPATNGRDDDTADMVTPMLVIVAAVSIVLYAGDNEVLGTTMAEWRSKAALVASNWRAAGPTVWHFLYDNYSRNQL